MRGALRELSVMVLKTQQNMDFLEDLERGHCVYIVAYKDATPDELLFAGYSYD